MKDCLKLNILLNSNLNGLSIDQINLGMISLVKRTGRDRQWNRQ